MKLDINAKLGAKQTLFGYELAETEVKIPMAGPWILAKYPSDGTEHKVGDTNGVQTKAQEVTEWKDFYNNSRLGASCYQDMQDIIKMLKEINGCTEAAARQMVIKRVQSGYNGQPPYNQAVIEDARGEIRMYKEEVEQLYYDYQYQKAGETGNYEWVYAEN